MRVQNVCNKKGATMFDKDVSSKVFEAEVAKDVFENYLCDEDKEDMREHDLDIMQRFMLGI